VSSANIKTKQNKMKYTLTIIALTMVLAATHLHAAIMPPYMVITKTDYSHHKSGESGVKVTTSNGEMPFSGYSTSTSGAGEFETFAAETHAKIHRGKEYEYSISDSDSSGRHLTVGTAYLYSQFAQGILSDYDYQNKSDRKKDAKTLQKAIWYLQDGQTRGKTPTVENNVFYAATIELFGDDATSSTDADTDYGVSIVNLANKHGKSIQNQLIFNSSVPSCVPETSTWVAGCLMLLPLGLSIIRIRRKA